MLDVVFPAVVHCNKGEVVSLPVKVLGDLTETRGLSTVSINVEEVLAPEAFYETEGAEITFASELFGFGALLIETAQAVPGAYLLRLKVILSNNASFLRAVRLEVA